MNVGIIYGIIVFFHFLILIAIIITLGYIIIAIISTKHKIKQNWEFKAMIAAELLTILFVVNMIIFHNEILSYIGVIFVTAMLIMGLYMLKKNPETTRKTFSIKIKYWD